MVHRGFSIDAQFMPLQPLDKSFPVVYLSSGSLTCTSYSSLAGECDRVQGRRRSAWHSTADDHGVDVNGRLGLRTAERSFHGATRSLPRRAIVVRRAKVARAKSTIRKGCLHRHHSSGVKSSYETEFGEKRAKVTLTRNLTSGRFGDFLQH